MVQLRLGSVIQIRGKLRERREFSVLRQRGSDTARELFNNFGLRRTTYPRDRDAGVHRGSDASVEHVSFKENLTVSNRDHVGRYKSGNVACLCFNHGEGR